MKLIYCEQLTGAESVSIHAQFFGQRTDRTKMPVSTRRRSAVANSLWLSGGRRLVRQHSLPEEFTVERQRINKEIEAEEFGT